MDSEETERSLEHAKRSSSINRNGEILKVRKDRHSKVYTAKGPRDRRVRLSAHTAIQFYDVQDRLGFDRPSKAVDWLIRKAKSAIDKLSQIPFSSAHDLNGNETDSFQFYGEMAENLIPSPSLPVVSTVDFPRYQNLGLSLQTQNDETVMGFDERSMVPWNNGFDGSPSPGPVEIPSGVVSAAANYAFWNDISITGQKYHPIHEQSLVTTTRFIPDGLLPEFEIHDDNDAVSGRH